MLRHPRRDQRQHHHQHRLLVYPLRILIFVGAIAVIATTVSATVGAALERIGCDGENLVRRLMLVDEGRTDAGTLDAAIEEVAAIWATAGVRLLWLPIDRDADQNVDRSEDRNEDRPDAFVILRGGRTPVEQTAASMKSGELLQLGWVRFDERGDRPNLIEVSLRAVRKSVMTAWYDNSPLPSQPNAVKTRVLGRALGRVIAHELGHWLLGQGHESDGLMKPILSPRELVAFQTPRLPRAWTDRTDLINLTDTSDTRMTRLRALCQ